MPYQDAIQGSPNVLSYWPLSEAAGSNTADDVVGNEPLSVVGDEAGVFGNADILNNVGYDLTASARVTNTKYLSTQGGFTGPSGDKTLEAWVKQSSVGGVSTLVGWGPISKAAAYKGIAGIATAQFTVVTPTTLAGSAIGAKATFVAKTTNFVESFQGVDLADGNAHHIVIQITPGGQAILWVDGQQVVTYGAEPEIANSFTPVNVGQNFNGFVSQAVFYSGLLSPHRIRQHWRIGAGFEARQPGQSERLFVPNGQCPQSGSFDIKSGYAIYYSDLQANGGIITADLSYLDMLRKSGYFTETAAP